MALDMGVQPVVNIGEDGVDDLDDADVLGDGDGVLGGDEQQVNRVQLESNDLVSQLREEGMQYSLNDENVHGSSGADGLNDANELGDVDGRSDELRQHKQPLQGAYGVMALMVWPRLSPGMMDQISKYRVMQVSPVWKWLNTGGLRYRRCWSWLHSKREVVMHFQESHQ